MLVRGNLLAEELQSCHRECSDRIEFAGLAARCSDRLDSVSSQLRDN
ncbi:hypothetical protein [Streptomyces sp. NPDC057403]